MKVKDEGLKNLLEKIFLNETLVQDGLEKSIEPSKQLEVRKMQAFICKRLDEKCTVLYYFM